MIEAILLDTSAFIAGYEILDSSREHYTVPAVKDELERDELIKMRFDVAVQTGKIRVMTPHEPYLSRVKDALLKLGEAGFASETDSELLALCLQLRAEGKSPILLSDDYSIQNLADYLDVRHRGMATEGIKRRFKWSIYCPGCRKHFEEPQPEDICPVCGTTLKRKPMKKEPLK